MCSYIFLMTQNDNFIILAVSHLFHSDRFHSFLQITFMLTWITWQMPIAHQRIRQHIEFELKEKLYYIAFLIYPA